MTDKRSKEQFSAVQLGWISILAHPGIADLLSDVAKPENALMASDASSLFEARGIGLASNAKTTLVPADGPEPMGVRLCISDDNDKFHCITIRSPFQNPFVTD